MNCVPFRSTAYMTDEEFSQLHRQYIGISELGAIAGLSSFKTPVMVYLEKIGEWVNDEENEALIWGKLHEETIAHEYARRNGLTLHNPEAICKSNELPYLIGTPDRFILDSNFEIKAVLEIKTTSEYGKKYWEGDNIPDSYVMQCQMYMHFFDLKEAHLACLVGGNKLVTRVLTYDPEMVKDIMAIIKDFWENHVEKRIPPPMTGELNESDVFNSLFPQTTKEALELPLTAYKLSQEYKDLQKQIKVIDKQMEAIANELKMLMGEHETGFIQSTRIDYPVYTRESIDSKALKAKYPDIYEQVKKVSKYRTLKVKERTEDGFEKQAG